MKKGLIIINAYTNLKNSIYQAERLKEELEKLGVNIDIKRNNSFLCYLDNQNNIISSVKEYDFCIYLDKDKYMSYLLEKSGLKLFNSAKSIELCDDKMTTFIELANNHIPVPITLPGLLCYSKDEKVKSLTLDRIENILSYPLIVKNSYGSLGLNVFKINNRQELESIAEKIKGEYHLFQEFIKTSFGKDIRVIVIGGKFLCAMKRESSNDFRSNIELGGRGTKINLPDELISLCEKVAHLLSLSYCGIDILFGEDKYYICEVNSNAFFTRIEKVTEVNVAKKYAEYIYSNIYKKDKLS